MNSTLSKTKFVIVNIATLIKREERERERERERESETERESECVNE